MAPFPAAHKTGSRYSRFCTPADHTFLRYRTGSTGHKPNRKEEN
jgi:hypothetical protein